MDAAAHTLTDGFWIANWNGLEYQVTRHVGGDVYIARLDGSDERMLMIEKFRRHLVRATR